MGKVIGVLSVISGICSIVLGLVSFNLIFFSFIAGLTGLIFGLIQYRLDKVWNKISGWGITFSLVGLLVSVINGLILRATFSGIR